MTTAKQHYDELLGEHYTWSAPYLDLGAGFGAHAVPLARAGKQVTAIDFHAGLLAELAAAAPSVETHEADLIAFVEAARPTWDAVLYLGDTLTHLPDRAAVPRLLAGCARVLAPGGILALAYRDYSGPPRTGLDRFIPVRHDARRALVCCVEAIDADHV
ncbi:MAG TPA: methyltransferase domain-containing protein, partial [Kofleriaceae bacterium]